MSSADSNWPVMTIAECASESPYSTQIGPFGKALTPEEYKSTGVPLLRGVNVNRGRFHDDDYVFVSEETADRLSKFESFPDDVLLVHKGTLGQIGLMPKHRRFDRYLMGNSMLRVKTNPNVLTPLYLYYWLCSPAGQQYIFSRVSQVGVPQIQRPLTTLREACLPVPPIKYQRRITAILGTLDDKIELNRGMNETLEGMAQALFKSWFVDFDPVIDNALAAGHTIPEPLQRRAAARQELSHQQPSLPAHLKKLFPDRFYETKELGWVPVGWEAVPVYDLAKYVNGAAFKTECFSDGKIGHPIIKIAELKSGITGQTKFTSSRFDERYFVQDGDILFSWSGNPDTSIDIFLWTLGDGWLNQHIFKVLPNNDRDRWFLYDLLRHLKPMFADIARDKQTTGLGHVTAGDLKRLFVCRPDRGVIDHYDRIVSNVHSKWTAVVHERQELASLRDTLLPRLLSGKLRIRDAEKVVAEVV